LFTDTFKKAASWHNNLNATCLDHINQLCLTNVSLKFDKNLDASRNCQNFFKNSNYITEEQINVPLNKNYNCSFSIMHTNVHSLMKNMDTIQQFISRLNYKFSVTAVSETWTDVNNEHLNSLDGNNKLIKHRGSGGGGVALFVNSDVTFEPMYSLNDTGTDEDESLFVDIATSPASKTMVGVMYKCNYL